MRDVSSQNFGLLIAYLLPGFTVLWGLSHVSPTVETWIGAVPAEPPTVGGFLYGTIASVAAGLTVSTLRWLIIDAIHHATGVARPNWNLSLLGERVAAFTTLIEIHYRYYQFYGGMEIALVISFALRWSAVGIRWGELGLLVATELLFFAASRDALKKYCERVERVLQGTAQ